MGEIYPGSITATKRAVTRSIKLIKENSYGKLKGRTCTDVRQQRCYISKEDASSLAISLNPLFTSIIIDAHEGGDVVIFDVPGAYLNADTL